MQLILPLRQKVADDAISGRQPVIIPHMVASRAIDVSVASGSTRHTETTGSEFALGTNSNGATAGAKFRHRPLLGWRGTRCHELGVSPPCTAADQSALATIGLRFICMIGSRRRHETYEGRNALRHGGTTGRISLYVVPGCGFRWIRTLAVRM